MKNKQFMKKVALMSSLAFSLIVVETASGFVADTTSSREELIARASTLSFEEETSDEILSDVVETPTVSDESSGDTVSPEIPPAPTNPDTVLPDDTETKDEGEENDNSDEVSDIVSPTVAPTITPSLTPTPEVSLTPTPEVTLTPTPTPVENSPVTEVVISQSQTNTTVLSTTPSFTTTSSERYQKYEKLREAIYDELTQKINELTTSYIKTIQEVTGLLQTDGNCKLYRLTYTYLDANGNEVDSDDDSAILTATPKEISKVSISNWGDILAVFVAQSTLEVNDPLDLVNLQQISWDGLDKIFSDMNSFSYKEVNGEIQVYLKSYSYQDMVKQYKLSDSQIAVVEELMQPEFQNAFAAVTGNRYFNSLATSQVTILNSPIATQINLSTNGAGGIVETACSLVGKVNYFWGGKYSQVGFNPSWGSMEIVDAEGSSSSGSSRAYGLDCSGYVAWVFVNAANNANAASIIGESTWEQWDNSASLGWDQAQPGDLAFLTVPGNGTNHVGIVVSVNDDGSYLVAHCSSSYNNVVVTDAWSSGFRYMRRPYILQSLLS